MSVEARNPTTRLLRPSTSSEPSDTSPRGFSETANETPSARHDKCLNCSHSNHHPLDGDRDVRQKSSPFPTNAPPSVKYELMCASQECRRPPKLSDRHRTLILCLAGVATLVAMAALAFAAFTFVSTSERLAAMETASCVPCRYLTPEVVSSIAPSPRLEDMCCLASDRRNRKQAQDDDSQDDRAQWQSYRSSGYDVIAPPLLCASHVYYDGARHFDRTATVTDPNLRTIEDWSSRGNHAFIRDGVGFASESGRFTVRLAGIYSIYGHVTFQAPSYSHIPGKANITIATRLGFKQRISVERNLHEHTWVSSMLEDSREVTCFSRGDHATFPCHVSSIVSTLYLKASDRIFVEISQRHLVQGNTCSSYFGFRRISD